MECRGDETELQPYPVALAGTLPTRWGKPGPNRSTAQARRSCYCRRVTEPVSLLTRDQSLLVEERFRHHREAANGDPTRGTELAQHPDAEVVEELTNAAFWASLRREETRVPRISLAYLGPEQTERPVSFRQRFPLAPATLARLGPAVERSGVHLCVVRENGKSYLWGVADRLPELCFVVEVIQPGLLVIKYSRRDASRKFGNVAVLEGNRIKLVDESCVLRTDCPLMLESLVGIDPAAERVEDADLLVQLALSMREHGHGGSLLVVPSGDDRWRTSVSWPAPYALDPPFSRLSELVRGPRGSDDPEWLRTLGDLVDRIAGLTAVDGAVVLNDRYELLAFGVMIRRTSEGKPVEQVVHAEPIVGNTPRVVETSRIGHTRHLSAAQFVSDQKAGVALVASQDGRFTIFTWSDSDQMVRADRIDALLL